MLSSHLISDLANVCDFLVVIVNGRVRLAGDLDDLLAEHLWLVVSLDDAAHLPSGLDVVMAYPQERNSRLLVRTTDPILNPALVTKPVDLEDLVLGYLETKRVAAEHAPRMGVRT